MAWRQQDYILRMIEQAGAAIRRALGLVDDGHREAAIAELRAATLELLGPAGDLVHQVDTTTAINIVGEPRRVAIWARLLAAESKVLAQAGDADRSALMRQRALEIARSAAARDEGAREEVRDLLEELED